MSAAENGRGELTPEAVAYLAAHAVDPELAASLGVRSVTRTEDLPEEFRHYRTDVLPAILFPWTSPEGQTQPQLKVLADPMVDWLRDSKGYLFRSREQGYQPPFWELRVGRYGGPVLICEGSKQCIVAARYAPEEWSVYGVAGCTSWGMDGYGTEHLGVVQGRETVILLDADWKTNPNVYAGAETLTRALRAEGALEVKIAEIPVTGAAGGAGLDDVLAQRKEGRRAQILENMLRTAAPLRKVDRPKEKLVTTTDGVAMFSSDGALMVSALSDAVDRKHKVALTREPFRVAIYRDGVYRVDQEAYFGAVAELLGNNFRRQHANEAEAYTASILSTTDFRLPESAPEPLLNCRNGMLDLRTGELRPHDPSYLSSMQVPVDWDPTAKCPTYVRWLATLLPDQALELEEASAQMLDPSRTPSKAVFNFGPSRSGKSTYLRILQAIVGQGNTSAVSLHQLSDDKFAAAEIYGKILNIDADVKSAHVEDLSLFKKMTGQDLINANRKYGKQFAFTNRALFAFSANELPTIGESSRAYTERIIPFKWGNSFAGHEDPAIEDKILEELPGILVRLVDAWRRQYERGGYAPTSQAVMAEFEAASDRVRRWLGECCQVVPTETEEVSRGSMSTKRDLARAFNRWAVDINHESKLGERKVSARLETVAGVRQVRGTPGAVRGLNIIIRPESEWGNPPGDPAVSRPVDLPPWAIVAESDQDPRPAVSETEFAGSGPKSASEDPQVRELTENQPANPAKPAIPTPPHPHVRDLVTGSEGLKKPVGRGETAGSAGKINNAELVTPTVTATEEPSSIPTVTTSTKIRCRTCIKIIDAVGAARHDGRCGRCFKINTPPWN